MGQFRTAMRVLREDGVSKAVRLTGRNIGRWYRTGSDSSGVRVVRLDGCRFALDHPAISEENVKDLVDNVHERAERRLCSQFLNPALPVIELGGNMGVVSCVVNRRLTDPRAHTCVEPNPHLTPLLDANRRRNGCQFTIVEAAIAYGSETVELNLDENPLTSRVGVGGASSIVVRAITLQSLVQQSAFKWSSLIMDVEGAEVDVISNEIDLLRRSFECLIIEFHDHLRGADANADAIERLQEAGFRKLGQVRGTIAMRNSARPGA